MNQQMKKISAVIVILILVLSSALVYFVLQTGEKETIEEEKEEFVLDDRVSPYKNQGLHVEILRIRNRELLDKILKIGTSWRNVPSYYYTLEVDGKESNPKGNLGTQGVYTIWDTMGKESMTSFFIPEEQKKSEIIITIMEVESRGLLGRRTVDVEKEKIYLTYDYRTGRWSGDDYFKDKDGYGNYLGENYEVYFNIYQSDFDHDDIPYWTEVNVLGTDPAIDDSKLDPDNDGIPTTWEWKWGYDPFTWDDHENLDPDIDGIENIEEYQMRDYFSNPYQPDIYIETDRMEKKNIFDVPHVFYEESQQMFIERFAQHGINVYVDDGWDDGPINGGGEMLPYHEYLDDMIGKQIQQFYEHNFADERKGIFRYVIAGHAHGGFISPIDYNKLDTIHVGNSWRIMLVTRLSFSPRFNRVCFAKGVLHEMGHSLGLVPTTFPGNDIQPRSWGDRYPSMSDKDYENYLDQYHSIMNYIYIWYDRDFFDYSDGSNGVPYDQNDWEHIYLPAFQVDMISYEEPTDETFEDFEVINEYPGVILKGWKLDENLTKEYSDQLKHLAIVKNTGVDIRVYVNTEDKKEDGYDVRVYAMPQVDPVFAVWTLVAEGNLDSNDNINLYNQQEIISSVYP